MKIKQADDFFYRVEANENEAEICAQFNTNGASILRNNPKLNFYAGEWVKIATNNYILHIVKPIETLTSIAKKYNTSEEKLVADNALKTNTLFIGQQLKIF